MAWQPVCSPGAEQAETEHPWSQAGWLDQQSQRALGFSKTPFLIEECGSYQGRPSVPSSALPHKHKHVCAHTWATAHAKTYANIHAYCMHMSKGSKALQK